MFPHSAFICLKMETEAKHKEPGEHAFTRAVGMEQMDMRFPQRLGTTGLYVQDGGQGTISIKWLIFFYPILVVSTLAIWAPKKLLRLCFFCTMRMAR